MEAATAAWLCAIPCAALVLAAGRWLGGPLGTFLRPPAHGFTFTAEYAKLTHPEQTETRTT